MGSLPSLRNAQLSLFFPSLPTWAAVPKLGIYDVTDKAINGQSMADDDNRFLFANDNGILVCSAFEILRPCFVLRPVLFECVCVLNVKVG